MITIPRLSTPKLGSIADNAVHLILPYLPLPPEMVEHRQYNEVKAQLRIYQRGPYRGYERTAPTVQRCQAGSVGRTGSHFR